jgi:RNA recognition motif-containing protein
MSIFLADRAGQTALDEAYFASRRFRRVAAAEFPERTCYRPTARGWPGHGDSQERAEGGAISSKVFVGNLSFQTTSEELQTVFSEVGEVASVVLPTDRASGRPRGFAFVEFTSEEHAAEAIRRFEGFELGGRRLRVNEATDQRSGPGGGGGGRFGRFGPDRSGPRPSRPKGSRRNARARKRSIW